MLKVIQVATPADKRAVLKNIETAKDSWVVSDLQSREEVQINLRDFRSHYEDLTVLRASELWSELLKRSFPEYRVAGSHLSRLVLSEFLSNHQQFTSLRATKTLLSYTTQLIPLLSHPTGADLAREWFENHPESSMRWRAWFELSFYAWEHFNNQKLLSQSWANAFLANHWPETLDWDRRIYFDLGLEIHQVEAELIKHLSEHCEVIVFEPVKSKDAEKDHSDRVYDLIREGATEVAEAKAQCSGSHQREYLRLATPLAEVKDSVSRVRQLLDAGVEPRKIAIVAPRLDKYWFCLKSYLDKEGVGYRRSSAIPLASLSSLQEWLADLRVSVGHLASSDMELSYYSTSKDPIPYEKFRALFSSIYEADHFSRDEDVQGHFQKAGEERLLRDEFVAFTITHWPKHHDFTPARAVLQALVHECSKETQFAADQWVEYLQALAIEQEQKIQAPDPRGIYCGDTRSVEQLDVEHIFFLGLTSSDINTNQDQQILAGDVEAIASDIGFYLHHPEQDHLEGLIRWLCQCSFSHQYYYFSLSDFNGTEMIPSKFWIKGALKNETDFEKILSPGTTRWDELRQNPALSLEARTAIEYDLGERERPLWNVPAPKSLSASSVESYLRCPFIYASQKVFRLSDEPIADVDFEARGRGLVIHRLFERLLEPPIRFDYTEAEIRAVLDDIAENEKITQIEKRFWPALRDRLVPLAQRFLEKERLRKESFQSTSTVGRELNFEFYFSPATRQISLSPGEGAIKFKGQIDRLDIDGEGYGVIYDYKMTKTQKMTHATKWLEKDQIQLPIYIMAVEAGATSAQVQEVIGAFYYIVKDLSDHHGFKLKEEEGRLYDLKDARQNKLDRAKKEELIAGIKELISSAVLKMISGEFPALPSDPKYCDSCPWSRICRAPHLH